MISEPELSDGNDFFRDARSIPEQRPEPHPPVEPEPSSDAGRRPWLWALGGALAASAVWAGVLYAHDGPTPEPDTGAWRATGNLCLDAQLKALRTELGTSPSATSPFTRVHPDQHGTGCSFSFQGDESQNRYPALVSVKYTLHKKIDPGPEFEAGLMPPLGVDESPTSLTRIERLGENAFFILGSGAEPSLHVLDGQAVLSLSVVLDEYGESGARPPTNLSGIKASMIADTRALMAKLQS
ncbi:hypothetical protein ABZ348_04750 [Streptomyces sp. NPDC005963]|uniref:hypothetical protein n=1 Tax=Streptomyces sp. NPDC005963 TaxID=3156721 RepID=UPI0033DA6B1C